MPTLEPKIRKTDIAYKIWIRIPIEENPSQGYTLSCVEISCISIKYFCNYASGHTFIDTYEAYSNTRSPPEARGQHR